MTGQEYSENFPLSCHWGDDNKNVLLSVMAVMFPSTGTVKYWIIEIQMGQYREGQEGCNGIIFSLKNKIVLFTSSLNKQHGDNGPLASR